ncbi:MAG: peptidoglycan DD-metalloendopeptidase family protein [Gammaproteobacteria bacterium]
MRVTIQFFLIWALVLPASELIAGPRQSLVPGGIALIELDRSDKAPHFSFKGKPVLVATLDNKFVAIVGLPLNLKPGEYYISGHWGNEKALQKKFFSVVSKEYTTQYINIEDDRKVNPYASDMARIWAEQKRQRKAKSHYSDTPVDVNFIQPTQGILTGSFGRRRIFNGEARRPHSGMDIAADQGVPVLSPADGNVVELGDFFFSGNLVYVHHGQGVTSLFAHMSEINVELGQAVKKGQLIGKVGATGRVTGPHLHWSLGLNGTWIDPALFLP